MDVKGKREKPRRNAPAYYLADDLATLIPVQKVEASLGQATIRFELSFDDNCQ